MDAYGNIISKEERKAIKEREKQQVTAAEELHQGSTEQASDNGSENFDNDHKGSESEKLTLNQKKRQKRKLKKQQKREQEGNSSKRARFDSDPGHWIDRDSMLDTPDPKLDPRMADRNRDVLVPQKIVLMEPKESCLSKKYHLIYLDAMRKFKSVRHPSQVAAHDMEEYSNFQRFGELVREEQAEFQRFTKSAFQTEEVLLKLKGMKEDVFRYIEERYEFELNKARACTKFYENVPKIHNNSQVRLFPLRHDQQTAPPQFEMRFDRTILEMGKIPKLIQPGYKRLYDQKAKGYLNVSTNYEAIRRKYPTNPDSNALNNLPVSLDPNLGRLVPVYLPQIVISAQALVTIFNNFGPNYDQVWEIPFRVQTYDNLKDGKLVDRKKVVFIDDPLPKKGMSLAEKNIWYHKIGARHFMLHPWTRSQMGHAMSKNRHAAEIDRENIPKPAAEADEDMFGGDLSALETFGTNEGRATSKAPADIPQTDGNNTTEEDSDTDEPALKIIEDSSPGTSSRPTRSTRSRCDSSSSSSSTLTTRSTRLSRSSAKATTPALPPPPTAATTKRRGRQPKSQNQNESTVGDLNSSTETQSLDRTRSRKLRPKAPSSSTNQKDLFEDSTSPEIYSKTPDGSGNSGTDSSPIIIEDPNPPRKSVTVKGSAKPSCEQDLFGDLSDSDKSHSEQGSEGFKTPDPAKSATNRLSGFDGRESGETNSGQVRERNKNDIAEVSISDEKVGEENESESTKVDSAEQQHLEAKDDSNKPDLPVHSSPHLGQPQASESSNENKTQGVLPSKDLKKSDGKHNAHPDRAENKTLTPPVPNILGSILAGQDSLIIHKRDKENQRKSNSKLI